MDIKSWCRYICITVIASGVLLSILPDTWIKKSYKCFVTLLTVYLFIVPIKEVSKFKNFFENINYGVGYTEEDLMLENTNIVIDCAEKLLEKRLNEIMNESGTDGYCKAYIKEKAGEAFIEKIEIYSDLSADEYENIVLMLSQVVGGETVFEFIGQDF